MTASPPTRAADLLRLAALLALALGALAAALLAGSSALGPARVLAFLAGHPDPTLRAVLLEIRLPRALGAFAVGSMLALAGVLLQALFRNPLADPFVLGVSGGAAVGALLAMLAGAGLAATRSCAVAGALAAMGLVQALAAGGGTARLLLTGVAVASASGALVTVLLSIAGPEEVRGMVFWLAGDLSWAQSPGLSVGAAAVAILGASVVARPLNVLAAGELRARSVGLDVGRWRSLIFVVSAALAGVSVVNGGTIGFVGLITPHAMRLLGRTGDHRLVAPGAALLGGTLVVLADLAARTVASPRQLPVGAILALIGAPLFVVLLRSVVRDPR